jgi:hypothetical protein
MAYAWRIGRVRCAFGLGGHGVLDLDGTVFEYGPNGWNTRVIGTDIEWKNVSGDSPSGRVNAGPNDLRRILSLPCCEEWRIGSYCPKWHDCWKFVEWCVQWLRNQTV